MTEDYDKMSADYAIHIAELWRAGKLIGADEDEVREALLDEVLRLRGCTPQPPVDGGPPTYSDLLELKVRRECSLTGKVITYQVTLKSNEVYLGDIEIGSDGFYYFWLASERRAQGGYWDQVLMRAVADTLEELNAPWQSEIEDFGK